MSPALRTAFDPIESALVDASNFLAGFEDTGTRLKKLDELIDAALREVQRLQNQVIRELEEDR